MLISDAKTGESLRHFALHSGDVAIADRGYCHRQAVVDTLATGAAVVLRLNRTICPCTRTMAPAGTWWPP